MTAGDTTVDSLTVNGAATIDSLEVAKGIEAANGKFQLTEEGALTVNGEATFTKGATVQNGLSVTGGASVDGNFAVTNGGLSVSGGESVLNGGLTVNNGDTILNGNLDVGAGDFKVDTDGNTEINGNLNIGHGNFTVDAATGDTVVKGSLNLGSLEGREVGEAIKGLEEYAGELKDANLPDKVGGIERDPEAAGDPGDGTTTIEGMAKFDSEGMTIGDTVVNDGKITVGAAGNQTVIEGGAITAKSLVLGTKDVGATIAGIEHETVTDEFGTVNTTTIEGALKVSDNGLISNADGSFTVDSNGGLVAGGGKFAANITGITMKAPVQMTLQGDYNYKGQSVIDLGITISDIDDRLDVLEDKTQNIKPGTGEGGASGLTGGEDTITVPDTAPGHTGITGDVTVGGEINAGEIVVGDKGSDNKTTIDGGNITTGDTTIDGSGINTGNITADTGNIGGIDMEDGTINTGNTTIDGSGINTGNITADTGNIGDIRMAGDTINTGATTINGSGMTVGTGENVTSITNDTVKAQNGDFDNLTAGSGTFGTGNNKTVINNDGVNVGGTGGTSIKHDEVRVGADENGQGGSYMNDTDVVSGEGVSLNDTAERVGHLENRVGKLEDRIDKVGAMSAAIANLRTMGYDPAAPTEIAVGVGQYRSETGVALGMFHYPNKDFMLSLSVSTSGDEVMGGIGATWKFGRKSPEKVLAAEKEKAAKAKLAKAEAMKKAAKEAKIKAQQERHAKLAAERAAQAEAAK